MTKLQRLYCDAPLTQEASIALTHKQIHYLIHVLRMKAGDVIFVFNGRDGEWRARLENKGKKDMWLRCEQPERAQTQRTNLTYCFAPLKAARLDYMVQKAVEMGTSCLQPVITDFTYNTRLNLERMRGNVIEAAEQCGILSLAACVEPVSLMKLLDNWPPENPLIFCDETLTSSNPLTQLQHLTKQYAPHPPHLGVLIGPEGGFSQGERDMLQQKPFVTAISLGKRILRADTAAVAALALINATINN